MKELCRICTRELCGNQRRWIFHPGAKLQVLLSHALRCDLRRDGRAEFACSKCVFMLERMYRFDTVIARVEALSVERLHRLLTEKDHLRQCISRLYFKHNNHPTTPVEKNCTVDMSGLHDAKYCALLEDDLMYSGYESWADDEEQIFDCIHYSQSHGLEVPLPGHKPRRCRGCTVLRVADSDYEAVCKVPRKVARSTSCGPSTRYSETTVTTASATLVPETRQTRASPDSDKTLAERPSLSNSAESLISTLAAIPLEREMEQMDNLNSEGLIPGVTSGPDKLQQALRLLQSCVFKPIQIPQGCKIPVLVKPTSMGACTRPGNHEHSFRLDQDGADCTLEIPGAPRIQFDFAVDLAELEDMCDDVFQPLRFNKLPNKSLIEEQQSQLNQYESAAGQCVGELQKAQRQVQSLQNKIQDSEASNKGLQERLGEMETELRSIRQEAQNHERTIENLTESLATKEAQAQELHQVIEGQNSTMCTLREIAHRNQLHNTQAVEESKLQDELVTLQSSLFSHQLKLESSRRAQKHTQRVAEDLAKARDRLQSDLEAALRHRETTENYNQDLSNTVKQLRSDLLLKEAQLKEMQAEKQTEVSDRDITISQLRCTLKEKERLVQCRNHCWRIHQPKSGHPEQYLLQKLISNTRPNNGNDHA